MRWLILLTFILSCGDSGVSYIDPDSETIDRCVDNCPVSCNSKYEVRASECQEAPEERGCSSLVEGERICVSMCGCICRNGVTHCTTNEHYSCTAYCIRLEIFQQCAGETYCCIDECEKDQ